MRIMRNLILKKYNFSMSLLGNNIYPKPIKVWLKAAPCMTTFLTLAILFPTAIYNALYHPHERIEKYHFRSGKFDRVVRKRDDTLRVYYKEAIEWNPNEQKIIPTRPALRF